ncbi:MAG: hypothetical protein A2Y56_11190 [Candidatus Aminicenantes bacterium RBG_13_63_10]|nr:MAG: hypothetical protein A2Y56_11190 [Candidatus Aminicenantes bacterium RBG_13_63_10]
MRSKLRSAPRSPRLRPKVIILGAGISGLALAARIAPRCDVTVLEAGGAAGGLARTIRHKGFHLDLGPHPLYSTEASREDVIAGLRRALGRDLAEIERTSAVWFNGRLFKYPLKMRDILSKLSSAELAGYGLSFVGARLGYTLGRRGRGDFASWVKARYGGKVYRLYFEEYTEKSWGVSPPLLSAAFAAERVPETNLLDVVTEAVTGRRRASAADHPHNPQKARSFFPRLGVGMIPDLLQREMKARGGRVLFGRKAVGLKMLRNNAAGVAVRHHHGRREVIPCDFLASTIPLPELASFLVPAGEAARLRQALPYSGLAFVFLFLKKERVLRHKWVYFPEKGIPFNRLSEIKNASAACAPPGRTSLCVEFACSPQEGGRSSDGSYVRTAVRELRRLGFISASDVCGSLVVREPNAYGLWLRGFPEHYQRVQDRLGEVANLASFGRQGDFQYFNLDHCLLRAGEIAGRIAGFFRLEGERS